MQLFRYIFRKDGIGRSFLVYFLMSSFLIGAISLGVLWSTIIFFVRNYEDEIIYENLQIVKQNVINIQERHQEALARMKRIYTQDPEMVLSALPQNTMFFVFDEGFNLLYGDNWQQFISNLFLTPFSEKTFLFQDNTTVYRVSSDIDELNYYFVNLYQEPIIPYLGIRSYSLDTIAVSAEKELSMIYGKLINQDRKHEFMSVPISSSLVYGVYCEFDNLNNIARIHIYSYTRDFYHLLQRSLFIAIYILVSSMVIITVLFFVVTVKKIFIPLWTLIDKMKLI